MIKLGMAQDVHQTASSPSFGIGRGVHQTGQAGQNHRAGAHGAGFEGAVERNAFQPPMTDDLRGLPDGDYFGVGGGVLIAFAGVKAVSDDFSISDGDGTNRDITAFEGFEGFVEGEAHKVGVSHGELKVERGKLNG